MIHDKPGITWYGSKQRFNLMMNAISSIKDAEGMDTESERYKSDVTRLFNKIKKYCRFFKSDEHIEWVEVSFFELEAERLISILVRSLAPVEIIDDYYAQFQEERGVTLIEHDDDPL